MFGNDNCYHYKNFALASLLLLSLIFTGNSSVKADLNNNGYVTDKNNKVNEAIADINKYCHEIDQYYENNSQSARLFANIAPSGENPNWVEFKDAEDLRTRYPQLAETDLPEAAATVLLRDNKVIYAVFTYQSESADWVCDIKHYFRNDGGLTKFSAQLNTFYGNISKQKEGYFDKIGLPITSSTKYFDLKTKKEKTPDETFEDYDFAPYKGVPVLPFYSKILESGK